MAKNLPCHGGLGCKRRCALNCDAAAHVDLPTAASLPPCQAERLTEVLRSCDFDEVAKLLNRLTRGVSQVNPKHSFEAGARERSPDGCSHSVRTLHCGATDLPWLRALEKCEEADELSRVVGR